MNQGNVKYSIVVPLFNEEAVVDELYSRLVKVMTQTGESFELVLVDDGSSDGTLGKLKSIAATDQRVVAVELRRNFGQTPALAAGFDFASGEIIISMDGDLQHIPEEIPNFIEKINDGYDVVSGWREKRIDNMIMRKIPSRIANWIASKISGVDIHDFGTTFKAYRRQIVQDIKLYGEMHRFIPALVSSSGAKIIEIPIKNVERTAGKSNYGISRTFRVAFDLITLRFILGYITKPLHFFGKGAFYCVTIAGLIFAYVLFDKIYYHVPIKVAHEPITAAGVMLLLMGMIFISTGLLGELISRVYFEATSRKIYAIRNVYNAKIN